MCGEGRGSLPQSTPVIDSAHVTPHHSQSRIYIYPLDPLCLSVFLQAISLLAWLACEEGCWGPHLIVVPTSVMLNWEMEFKKYDTGTDLCLGLGGQGGAHVMETGYDSDMSDRPVHQEG